MSGGIQINKLPKLYMVNIIDTDIRTARISNTALNSRSAGARAFDPALDWITLAGEDINLEKFQYFLSDRLAVVVDWQKYQISKENGQIWQYFSGTFGATVGIRSAGHDRTSAVRLCLPGEWFGRWSNGYVQRTLGILAAKFDVHCTRIDVKVDDYNRELDFKEIWDSIQNGWISGFSKAQFIESYGGSTAGKTIYLGTRKSNKFGRIYDRMGVTNGKENCIRYEVEYKRAAAHAVFIDYIKASKDNYKNRLAAVLRGSFDFVIKKDKNLDRATRLPFWDKFLERISAATEYIIYPKKQVSIERTISWIHRSVSKSLLILDRAVGITDSMKLLELWKNEAATRLSDLDRANILQSQFERLSYADFC